MDPVEINSDDPQKQTRERERERKGKLICKAKLPRSGISKEDKYEREERERGKREREREFIERPLSFQIRNRAKKNIGVVLARDYTSQNL